MGDINRQIVTTFSARGGAQVRATMGEITGGLNAMLRQQQGVGRQTGYLNNQMRALGTTMRYAVAGSAIYGAFDALNRWAQYQARLGEISAIASFPGVDAERNRAGQDSAIDRLGRELIRVSVETAQPLDDLQQGVIGLYSTVGDVPPNRAAEMLQTISGVAITSQANIEDTTNALLGMLGAFNRGTSELEIFGRGFRSVIQLSAGMTGHVYAQQLGRLSTSAALGQFNPAQMEALAIGASRFGGSQPMNMRGLAQMMMYLMNPPTSKNQRALERIGLGRKRREALGGWGTLQALLTAVNSSGGANMQGSPLNAKGVAGEEALGLVTELYGPEASNEAIGLKGPAAQLLSEVFSRIEGRRIAAILSQLQREDQVRGSINKTLDQYLEKQIAARKNAEAHAQAVDRALDRRKFQQAGNAIRAMGIEIMDAYGPFINAVSGQVINLQGRVHNNPELTAYGLLGAAGAAAAIRRVRGGRGIGAIRGVGAAGAAQDAITGGAERGHSPQNPLYVAVVFSMGGPGGGNPVVLGPDGKPVGTGNTGKRSRLGNLAAFARMNPLHPLALPFVLGGDSRQDGDTEIPLLRAAMGAKNLTPAQARVLADAKRRFISPQTAEARLLAISQGRFDERRNRIQVVGQAKINLNLNLKKADGSTETKRVSVTADLVPRFKSGSRPQSKGKDRTYRGGR